MPVDYEVSDAVQELLGDDSYQSPETQKMAIMRLERKLGRKLTVPEAINVLNEIDAPDPQKVLARFTRCEKCGEWIDNGKLEYRVLWQLSAFPNGACSFCEIPF